MNEWDFNSPEMRQLRIRAQRDSILSAATRSAPQESRVRVYPPEDSLHAGGMYPNEFTRHLSSKARKYLEVADCITVDKVSFYNDCYEIHAGNRDWLLNGPDGRLEPLTLRSPEEVNAYLEAAYNEKISAYMADLAKRVSCQAWFLGSTESEHGPGTMLFCHRVAREYHSDTQPEMVIRTEYVIAKPVRTEDATHDMDLLQSNIGGLPLFTDLGDEADHDMHEFQIIKTIDPPNERLERYCDWVPEDTEDTYLTEFPEQNHVEFGIDDCTIENVNHMPMVSCQKAEDKIDRMEQELNASCHACRIIDDETLTAATREAVSQMQQSELER